MIGLQPPSATLTVSTSNGVRRSDEYSRTCARKRVKGAGYESEQ
jgi:hypothetical protein